MNQIKCHMPYATLKICFEYAGYINILPMYLKSLLTKIVRYNIELDNDNMRVDDACKDGEVWL